MRILAKVDKGLDVTDQLENLKESYEGVTDVEWETEEIDGENLRWETYYGDNKGIEKHHITMECARVFADHGYEFDHIIWFVSRDNWGADGIGGWNLGRLYSNYAVQIVLAEQSGKWAGKTLQMEVAHAFDELAPVELGVDLDKHIKVDGQYLDFDKDIVHGEHPKYGVKQDDGYFTDYDYTKLIRDFAPVIEDIYIERRKREKKERIKMLKRIVRLYRKLIQLSQAKPTPAPLEGNHNHHG